MSMSRWVLGGAALVAAPALWHGFVTGQVSVDTAVTRWAVTTVLLWAALTVLVTAVGKPERRGSPALADAGGGGAAADGADEAATGRASVDAGGDRG